MANKKPIRYAVLWRKNDQTIKGCYITQDPKHELGTPEKALQYAIESTSYNFVRDNEVDQFIRDAKNGAVTIAMGYNVKSDTIDNAPTGTLYSSDMHSVNNTYTDIYIKNKTKGGYYGYGFSYMIDSERPLNASEMKVIIECENTVHRFKEVDNLYYLVMLLLRQYNTEVYMSGDDCEDYGRYVNDTKFNTKKYKTYETSQAVIEHIKNSITESYNNVVEITGQRLLCGEAELPEAFIASRIISNKDFTVDQPDKNTKDMATIYGELMKAGNLTKKIISSRGDSNSMDNFSLQQLPHDESVAILGYDSSLDYNISFNRYDIKPSAFENIPDCILFITEYPKDDVYRRDERLDGVVVWGNTKILIETLGLDSFIKYIKSQQQSED